MTNEIDPKDSSVEGAEAVVDSLSDSETSEEVAINPSLSAATNAVLNSHENAEVQAERSLLWYIDYPIHNPPDHDYAVYDSNRRRIKGFSDYEKTPEEIDVLIPELRNEVEAHNDMVVAELEQRFAVIAGMEEAERGPAIEAEYSRLESIINFDNNYELGKKNPPLLVAQIREIAGLFAASGRIDLAEKVNGVELGKVLWEKMKLSKTVLEDREIFELNELIENGYFTPEEMGITNEEFEQKRSAFYLADFYDSLAYVRVAGLFSSEDEAGPNFIVEALVDKMKRAGLTPVEAGFTEVEWTFIQSVLEQSEEASKLAKD